MIPKWHKHHCMGVLNLTPDSFSDGGKYNDAQSFVKKYVSFLDSNVFVLDIGAESTAPFNKKISFEEEKERLENSFLENLSKLSLEGITLSIDTYRAETFSYVYNRIKKVCPTAHLIWNDVSGVIDNSLVETLERCPDVDYVYCHTLTRERGDSQKHMDSVVQGDIIVNILDYFDAAMTAFEKFGLGDRIIFDPCLGFSKNLDQNHQLLSSFVDIVRRFPIRQRWLIGISKKSFLCSLAIDKQSALEQSELIHTALLSHWMLHLKEFEIFYRLHDFAVYAMAARSANILDQA